MLTYPEKRSRFLKIQAKVNRASECIANLISEQSEKLKYIKQKETELETYYNAVLKQIPVKLEYAIKLHTEALADLAEIEAIPCLPFSEDASYLQVSAEERQRYHHQVERQILIGVKPTK